MAWFGKRKRERSEAQRTLEQLQAETMTTAMPIISSVRAAAGGGGSAPVAPEASAASEASNARLDAGALVAALELDLEYEPVPAEKVVSGEPSAGYAVVDVSDAGEIGVWELTAGAMRDTEVSEVFVVLAGSATVEFVDPPRPSIELAPGAVVRLDAGMQTVWTVREPLRKVFIER